MLKKIIAILIISTICLIAIPIFAQENLGEILAGRILLQVESYGEAWYINPADNKKYYLDRPADAFSLMQNLSTGITNEDLIKIPIGLIDYHDEDNDNDGLSNRLENALGTNINNSDSDNDGYDDKTEIINNYNPLGEGKLNIDYDFTNQNLGKIFLQIEGSGEAWYINPTDKKRYFLNRPSDAFVIMKNFSLGITNNNINKITTGFINNPSEPTKNSPEYPSNQVNNNDPNQVFAAIASAIRQNKTAEVLTYFIPEMQTAIEYTMNYLNAEGRLILGNIISGSTLSSSTEEEKIYSTEVYFSLGGYKVPLYFHVQKQADNTWKLTNL